MYFKKMIGERCYLSPIDTDDAAKYTEWLNDMDIVQYLSLAHMVISMQSEQEVLKNLSRDHNYGIIENTENRLVGNCGLMDIDHINQTAEAGIFIGDKEFLNRSFGREALSLLIDYSFRYLNLQNIMLRVYSFNERAIKCYGNIGFKTIGTRRNAIRRNLKVHDFIFMDIIPDDFYRSYAPR